MLENIAFLQNGTTHLFTAENVYGRKGAGGRATGVGPAPADVQEIGQYDDPDCRRASRELGQGWKVRPCITLPAGTTQPLLDVRMSGAITHLWITGDTPVFRDVILRFYWDDEEQPSVECPLGDFFAMPFGSPLLITSIPINVNPTRACNCYFPMPFRRAARITAENRNPVRNLGLFYAISAEEREVRPEEAYFHAQFRRQNPTDGKHDYVILDGVRGRGQYVGTVLGWQQNHNGWWGEGEVKMFLDGDTDFPTYVGTGTEDYFGGAWDFGSNFSAPFLGYQRICPPDEQRPAERAGNRCSMYRFHLADPIRFASDLRVQIQTIGWHSEGRFYPLRDDICSVAYWYQTEPHAAFPKLGSRDDLEVV